SQQSASEQFAVVFIKIGAKDDGDNEVHNRKCPTLPEMQRAGDKKHNGQRDLCHHTPTDEARQKIFSGLIFQCLKNATLNRVANQFPPRRGWGIFGLGFYKDGAPTALENLNLI